MQLDQKALIEEAVQASIDAGLAVNGEHGVAAARHGPALMIIQIKPLEWLDHRGHTFPDTWTALTPCGVFEIEERSAGDSPAYLATGPMYAFIADKDSLEEAKAAAQADYERRISAALTATASAEPVGWQHRFRKGWDMDGEWGPWRYGRAKMHSIQSYYEERPLYAAPLPAQGGKADE